MLISIISFVVALVVAGVDQLTKWLVFGSPARSIIGDFLWFQSTLNTGAAFSILEGNGWVLITISAIASIFLCYIIISRKHFNLKPEKILFGVILGGTISNLIDRIILGGVRDFLYLRFIHFAIFNVADMAIVFGVIILAIYVLVHSIKKDKK